MLSFDFVEPLLLSLVVVTNSMALIFLKRNTNGYRNKTQTNIITVLCVYELLGGLLAILYDAAERNVTSKVTTSKLLDVIMCLTDIYSIELLLHNVFTNSRSISSNLFKY